MFPLHAAWESVNSRYPVSYEAFKEAVSGWEIHPVYVDGKTAGAVLVDGPEIHACILPFAQGRWLGRKQLRLINVAIEKYGFAQTKATTPAGEDFVKRLGFVKHGNLYKRTEKWALKQS